MKLGRFSEQKKIFLIKNLAFYSKNFRIKRTVPGSHRSFGHALRVRRDGFDDTDADVQKFEDDNVDIDVLNENQVHTS